MASLPCMRLSFVKLLRLSSHRHIRKGPCRWEDVKEWTNMNDSRGTMEA